MSSGPVLVMETPRGRGGLAVGAAVGAAVAADSTAGVLIVEVGAERPRGPTMLASQAARDLEAALRGRGLTSAAARGRVCWLGLDPDEWSKGLADLSKALPPDVLVIVAVPPGLWVGAPGEEVPQPQAAVLRGDARTERSLLALAFHELQARGVRTRIATRPLGAVAARRALAGLDPGGAAGRRAGRLARRLGLLSEAGQALPLALGGALTLIVLALALVMIGGAVAGATRTQRAADLAALSGARSMRDDLPLLLAPAQLPSGASNPRHLAETAYLSRAEAAAREAAARNGVDAGRVEISFPDRDDFPPVRVRVAVRADVNAGGEQAASFDAHAEAEAAVPSSYSPQPSAASGGGYSGPLAYRQGKPMRPDVAAAFDRLAAAALAAGTGLVITSAYRSDAEQARLFAANPDPRWVAPPGHSLHRCATELDLGPPPAYAWLAANAGRFGFLKRYSWEPWHFGFTRGPAPCSAAGSEGAPPSAESPALPAFVPAAYRPAILRAAGRWQVSAGLLAAQLMAESGFDPHAISPVGAQGIAQFMPGTAATYGLSDPFDAGAAIDAQAHLMSDLLSRFGSIPLALAAYNAGPGAVEACSCVLPYPETQAYVARILALMGSTGDVAPAPLEVRLVD